MIGPKLSPILEEIEDLLWEWEVNAGIKPNYTTDGFRASTKIFMSAILDKMWDVQEFDKMPMHDREVMAEQAGNVLRQFVKTYTGIDTFDLYEKNNS